MGFKPRPKRRRVDYDLRQILRDQLDLLLDHMEYAYKGRAEEKSREFVLDALRELRTHFSDYAPLPGSNEALTQERFFVEQVMGRFVHQDIVVSDDREGILRRIKMLEDVLRLEREGRPPSHTEGEK